MDTKFYDQVIPRYTLTEPVMSAVTFPLYYLPFFANSCTMLTAVSPMPLFRKVFFWAGDTNGGFICPAVASHGRARWTLLTKQHLRGQRVSVLVLGYFLVGPCKRHGKKLRKQIENTVQSLNFGMYVNCFLRYFEEKPSVVTKTAFKIVPFVFHRGAIALCNLAPA